MRRHRFCAALLATTVLALSPVMTKSGFGQGADLRNAPDPSVKRPAPRTPEGKINFGAPPGELGLWLANDNRMAIPTKPEDTGDRDLNARFAAGPTAYPKIKVDDIPWQPWSRAIFQWRTTHEFEPYTRCKPAGGLRMVATAYGTDFLDIPEQKRIYITQTGGPHSFRPIYMDGRQHPTDLEPSYYGHSIGWWEGDTLVVDTVGYNERGWIDLRGIPTTTQLHTIERFDRLDFDTLRYTITIDDPGAYTAPWTSGMDFRWDTGAEQFEFVCQDGNLAPILMIGEGNVKVDRSSRITP
jgi:hypothetical protein